MRAVMPMNQSFYLVALLLLLMGCNGNEKVEHTMPNSIPPLSSYEKSGDSIYRLDGAIAPWGDYGSILFDGMSAHLGRRGGDDGPIQLERTGPFVPPISFPGIGDIIVTEEMKVLMEQSGFKGISFRPVEKAHIANVPWHKWDLTADEPPFYPDGGEPEGYILNQPHSPDLANAMGTLWEVVLTDSAELLRNQGEKSYEVVFTYVAGTWNGNDIFSVPQNRRKYVSPRAKLWLETHFSDWATIRDLAED